MSMEQDLLDLAEATDRKMGPGRVAQLKQSYAFMRDCGMDDEAIKAAMALTGHEMRLIRA